MRGFARPCARCGALEAPGVKHLLCACRAAGMVYCGKPCQVAHWKVHKVACASRKPAAGGSLTTGQLSAALAGVQGGAAGAAGGGREKVPSKKAIDRMTEWVQNESMGPCPGTEDAEAWKVVVLQIRAKSSRTAQANLDDILAAYSAGTGYSTEKEAREANNRPKKP
ncbi:hypothetical protein T484DRAFT_1889429 [Baffinella frigidus]|nr:hypothetical protein T484DRAFT_1889429 [Cryptophyta sp. CCMP2293]